VATIILLYIYRIFTEEVPRDAAIELQNEQHWKGAKLHFRGEEDGKSSFHCESICICIIN
jgi:hypothetical protein